MQHEALHLGAEFSRRPHLEAERELQPNFELLGSAAFATTWTHLVAGHFSDSPYDSVFCYDQATGRAEFRETDGRGALTVLAAVDDWHTGWTHVVTGRFSNSSYDSLICYDAATGQLTTYDVDGHGEFIERAAHHETTNTWTHLTTVRLANTAYSGLVLYDQSAGRGEIREGTAGGDLHLRQASGSWRTTWTHVVGGSALLFYEGATGHCEIYQLTYEPGSDDPATNDPGSLGPMVESDTLPAATDIVPGSFGWDTTFLFYNRGAGTLDFVFLVYGVLGVVESHPGVNTGWDVIVPAGLWVADDADLNFPHGGFSDLLCYDRTHGEVTLYLHEPPQSTPSQDLAGYTWPTSARPGESIEFFVSSHVGAYTMRIYRQADEELFMADVSGLPTAPTPLPITRTAWRDGAGWPAVATLQIPGDWPSGLYLARVEATGATPLDIPFIVRSAVDAGQSNVLVALNDTTYSAYNHWGGRSHYGFGSCGTFFFSAPGSGDGGLPWGYRVSLRRPQASVFTEYDHKWTQWEVPLAGWLARRGVAVEWCTLLDLQADPGLLNRYALLVNVGHNEYVSAELRDSLVRFVTAGGNAAFFGGNNVWWRIRVETDTTVCFKNGAFDPEQSAPTVNWTKAQAAEVQGVAWSGYAFAGNPRERVDAEGLIRYRVVEPEHWVFEGTNLGAGEQFGAYGDGDLTIVGSETDARVDESPDGFTTRRGCRTAIPTQGRFPRSRQWASSRAAARCSRHRRTTGPSV